MRAGQDDRAFVDGAEAHGDAAGVADGGDGVELAVEQQGGSVDALQLLGQLLASAQH